MREVYLGLGSNLGDKHRNLNEALELLDRNCRVLALSCYYSTEPVGYREQDWFLNCAAEVETGASPRELLEAIGNIESALGRQRNVTNGPRTIDIDILLYGGLVIDEDGLWIPHPRLHERLFVLATLNEIAPGAMHPVLGKTVGQLWRDAPRTHRVERLGPGLERDRS